MYSKLFEAILDSSIWLKDAGTRLVWLTMLAAKNQDGFVRFATTENVATRARVSIDEANNAIAILEAPDPDSSNPDHEGRRIERVPGGWMILNAKFYDDIARREQEREQTRLRVERHRRKKSGEPEPALDLAGTPAETPKGKTTWLTPICAVWESKMGAGTFPAKKAAGLLGKLTKAGHSPDTIAQYLTVYLRTTDVKFVSLARFAETFASWGSANGAKGKGGTGQRSHDNTRRALGE